MLKRGCYATAFIAMARPALPLPLSSIAARKPFRHPVMMLSFCPPAKRCGTAAVAASTTAGATVVATLTLLRGDAPPPPPAD